MLDGGKAGGELVWRAMRECCLTGAGAALGLWQEAMVMEWTSLAGLGAVGGGAGLGETGGGIFFPSTAEMENKQETLIRTNLDPIMCKRSDLHLNPSRSSQCQYLGFRECQGPAGGHSCSRQDVGESADLPASLSVPR